MIWILCEDSDGSARWAAAELQARGRAVRVLTSGALAEVTGWCHRVSASGAACELRLAGGEVLRSGDARGVLNRLPFVPSAWLGRHGGPDRTYAIQEMYAFYLSWLHALPGPVLNPPTPQGLSGNARHASAWVALARTAGLPVAPYHQSSEDGARVPAATHMVHVVGGRVLGAPAALHAGCLELARRAGAPLLGVAFVVEDGWRFAGASVLPDLIGGGAPLADALAEVLS